MQEMQPDVRDRKRRCNSEYLTDANADKYRDERDRRARV